MIMKVIKIFSWMAKTNKREMLLLNVPLDVYRMVSEKRDRLGIKVRAHLNSCGSRSNTADLNSR